MEIKKNETLGEQGLFSTKFIESGQIVFILDGTSFDHPTRESIHVGNNVHIHDKMGMFINHSFTPSTKIEGYNVVAINDISPGDEITFDYNASELAMACPFEIDGKMVCGSTNHTEDETDGKHCTNCNEGTDKSK